MKMLCHTCVTRLWRMFHDLMWRTFYKLHPYANYTCVSICRSLYHLHFESIQLGFVAAFVIVKFHDYLSSCSILL